MKFAVIGGDRRSAWLCALLEGDGHRVYTYALEKAELPKEVPKAGCLQGCVYGADWVILPTPAERGGVLNAPYSSEQLRLEEIISALWPGQVLCGGKLSQSTAVGAVRAGLQVVDLMQRRDFAVGNAAVTAEGAAELMMKSGERCLWGSRVLVTGWGRVAKILALRLYALGALVTVSTAAILTGYMSRRRSLTSSRTPYRRGCWRMISSRCCGLTLCCWSLHHRRAALTRSRREALACRCLRPRGCRESMLHTPRRSL